MRIVIQRVKEASVSIDGNVVGAIQKGILVFLAVSKKDDETDIDYLVEKITGLRIFEDDQGKMNVSSVEAMAEFLVVSQFTLYGDCRKGRRPSFDGAADPEKAEKLYHFFVERLRQKDFKVETGRFAAMMDVSLINDGPVTLLIDSLPKKD